MPTEPRFEIRARLELPVDVKSETAYEDAAAKLTELRLDITDDGFQIIEWKARPIRRRMKQAELPLESVGAQIRGAVS